MLRLIKMTDDKGAGEGPYRIGIPDEYTGTTDYVSHRLVGPGLGRWGAPDVSDLMPDEGHLALLVDAANAIYAAGRKAERERCLRILRSHQGKCEEILLTDYLETPF
jgi:hypothetical protein